MTTFTEALAGFRIEDGSLNGAAPEGWGQGRTLYGGMTAALALHAALRLEAIDAPLRSALVAFVGPAEGALEARVDVLRRGRNVSFLSVDVRAEKGVAARCVFAFGGARPSMFDHQFASMPEGLPAPQAAREIMRNSGPGFAQRFEVRHARGERPFSSAASPGSALWVRHRDRAASWPEGIVALADMPPPAVLPMFREFAPISSMTWQLNLLIDEPPPPDAFLLLDTRAENAAHGYASQDMFIWTEDGRLVGAGRQSVAIFA